MTVDGPMADWDRWMRWLPFGLLALGVAVGTVTAPTLDQSPGRNATVLVLAAATGAWMAAWTFAVPPTPRRAVIAYVGRTALAFALCWLNPLYAIFAFVGYLDAFVVFTGRRAYPAVLATAVIMAGAQSGGLPPREPAQWAVFGALVVLNAGLAIAFTQMHVRVEATSDRRATTIDELQRVNLELEQALAENARLHETVVGQARTAGVQEERRRLAREIHDTLAQSLAGIVTQLQAAQDDPASSPGRVVRATDLARQALVEARHSMLELSPLPLEGTGLVDALGSVVGDWAGERDVQVDLVVTGDQVPLHPEVEATVVRVTQEALTNVSRHAAATRVAVTLSFLDGEVVLDVRDDGIGFDTTVPAGTGSFGLRGMCQRAARLAGVLEVESEPGQGATVSARLPALARGAAA